VPALKEHVPDPAAAEYVVIKMSPDNMRAISEAGMEYTKVEG
jgi:hypothetical protein